MLGPDLMVWSAALFIKEANSTKIVSWHQDLTYWGLDDSEENHLLGGCCPMSVWASGAMKFVAGSHKQNIVDHVDTFSDDNLLSRGQEIAVDVNEEDAVAGELKSGQAYCIMAICSTPLGTTQLQIARHPLTSRRR